MGKKIVIEQEKFNLSDEEIKRECFKEIEFLNTLVQHVDKILECRNEIKNDEEYEMYKTLKRSIEEKIASMEEKIRSLSLSLKD